MRNPKLARWRDWQADVGMLFFSQRIEELLFNYTLDTYKAPALNTLSRSYELRHVLGEVRTGAITSSAIGPVTEELVFSLRSDSAAKAVLGSDWLYYADIREWSKSSAAQNSVRVRQLIAELEGKYEEALVSELKAMLPDSQQKYTIERLAADLVVQWMTKGFSSDYIFWRVRQFFFAPHGDTIHGQESLERFLAYFEREEREWTVLFRGSSTLAHLEGVFPDELIRVRLTPPESRTRWPPEQRFLDEEHEGVFLEVDVQALDARTARKRAHSLLENLVDLARFHVHRARFDWGGDALVYGADGGPLILKPSTAAIRKHSEPQIQNVPEPLVRTFTAFSPDRLGMGSWRRGTAAVGLHSAALRSESVEAQLFALWSALESMLPVEDDQATINQVVTTVVPVLCRGYPRKLLTDVNTSLSRCLGRTYSPILDEVEEGADQVEKCGALLVLEKYEDHRARLYIEAEFNPLLKFRIFQVREKLARAAAVIDTISSHEKRVTWHLHRIYRSRNMLVHTGRLLPYYETLVENLHSYLHRVMRQLELAALRNPKPAGLDAVFMRAGFDHRRHLDCLTKAQAGEPTASNVLEILFGPER